MLPGLESNGAVSPIIARPVETTEAPSQTMATQGPEERNLHKPPKNGMEERSA